MKIHKALATAAAFFAAACSSDGQEMTDGALQAPMLMGVVPMEGALHIMW